VLVSLLVDIERNANVGKLMLNRSSNKRQKAILSADNHLSDLKYVAGCCQLMWRVFCFLLLLLVSDGGSCVLCLL